VTAHKVGEASDWNDLPFQVPPLPFRGRLRRAATELICSAGMAVAKAARVLGTRKRLLAPERILVVRRGGLGDVLMATPLLRGLREHFPSARIWMLTSQQAVAGLQGSPLVDQILLVPSSKKARLSLLRKLREERIDTAFILHRYFAPSLLALLAGIPQRLGFAWKSHGCALTGSIPFSPARSQTLQIAQLLTLVGKPAAEIEMQFPVSQDAARSAQELLRGWGYDPAKYLVGIHPGGGETAGSSEPAKRWLPQRFGELADLLADRKIHVLMLQGPGDEPFVQEALRKTRGGILGIAADLPLPVFAALMKECDLVVVNDTGPMHIAAAQKVPVVAIVGPTHPAYTPPQGEMHKVIWAGVPCSPCYHPEEYVFGARRNGKKLFECWRGTHECMAAITAEEVCSIVERQIVTLGKKPLRKQISPAMELSS
jgi:lipopolysaccharide heptosyltransferase II